MALRTLTILATLLACAGAPALAKGERGGQRPPAPKPYGPIYSGIAYGGFAQPFIQGDTIGEPYAAIPRPSHLVPTPWSYGTYGIPTVSGIPAPPVGQPTLTVIHTPGSHPSAARPAAYLGDDPADVRVVDVRVPKR